MAMPRTPLAKAKATGSSLKQPGRFANRREPRLTAPLGNAPSDFDETELLIWECFKREIPWLLETDRLLIEVATKLRKKVWDNTFAVSHINSLHVIMSKLGATPTDRTKVYQPDDPDEDPEDKFFN
jgi:hypothetical protein